MAGTVAKNTLYFTAASIAQKLLAFVYFLFLARVMEPAATGQYFLALSVTTIFSTITDFGVTPVVIRDVAKFPERAKHLVREALGYKLPFIVLAIIGAISTAYLLGYDPLVQRLVLIACLVMLADTFTLIFYGVLRGHHALRYESLGVFIGQTCTLLAGGATLLFYPSLPLLVLSLLVGSTFNAIYSGWHVSKLLGTDALIPKLDWKPAAALFRAALPFALAGIFVKVYSYVDSIFISKYLGSEAVGVYSIAYKFTYAFQFLPMAFTAALYPALSAVVGRDAAASRRLFDDALWYVLIIASPIAFGLWAVASDAVALAGHGYADAAPVLSILIFVLIPIFLDFPVGSLLNASDRQATKMAVMGVTMVINFALNAILVPRFGIIGAAWAGVVSFTFLFVAGFFFVARVIPRYGFVELGKTAVPIIFSGLVMGILAHLLRPVLGFVLVIPVAAVAYVVMLLLTRSLRDAHVQKILSVLRRKPAYEDTIVHD
ncbi:flippase [bacterium]|nr:flippase [bacterium]